MTTMFMKIVAALLLAMALYETNVEAKSVLEKSATKAQKEKYKLSYADYNNTWVNYKKQYGKVYNTKWEEFKRFNIFMENVNMVESHNLKFHQNRSTFWMDINRFSDQTSEERRGKNNFLKVNRTDSPASTNYECVEYHPNNPHVPSEIDWRVQGYINPVKSNEDSCSHFVYPVVETVEGQWFAKTGSLISLSKQQIRDCSTSYGNYGCHGGTLGNSFEYLVAAGGMEFETAYPTQDMTYPCRYESYKAVATVTDCKRVVGGESGMLKAVGNVGPISISMWSDNAEFYHYAGGIYDGTECNGPYPMYMLMAGYGTLDCNQYWLVKTTIGPDWGENGYIKVARNKGNLCGIASEGYFPVV